MAMSIVICLLFFAAIVGAMKVVHAPRHCRTCGQRIDGTPELEDRRGNCWHFECWQADQVRMRQFSAKIVESKLPRFCDRIQPPGRET
jgi:hypothetical protein